MNDADGRIRLFRSPVDGAETKPPTTKITRLTFRVHRFRCRCRRKVRRAHCCRGKRNGRNIINHARRARFALTFSIAMWRPFDRRAAREPAADEVAACENRPALLPLGFHSDSLNKFNYRNEPTTE